MPDRLTSRFAHSAAETPRRAADRHSGSRPSAAGRLLGCGVLMGVGSLVVGSLMAPAAAKTNLALPGVTTAISTASLPTSLFTAASDGVDSAAGLPEQCDPSKVLTADRCASCHAGEFNTWKNTPHAQTFEDLHRMPEAKAIAERMGFSSVKRGGLCLECHYTVQAQGDKLKPIDGVSCESCHGASSDWITVHNDYGGPGVSREDESAAHARQRREQSIAAGMRNPRNLYSVAQSCFGCHSIRREDLINHGGHQLASTDFELVAWSQGRVRHNFLRTNNVSNEPSPPERLRVMYVVGVLADLEYATRATAVATTVGPYGVASAQRAADRALKLKAIQEAVQDPLLQEVLTTFAEAELVTNNAEQLLAVAERISELGSEFAEKRDGSTLGAIDAWLPSPANYR